MIILNCGTVVPLLQGINSVLSCLMNRSITLKISLSVEKQLFGSYSGNSSDGVAGRVLKESY